MNIFFIVYWGHESSVPGEYIGIALPLYHSDYVSKAQREGTGDYRLHYNQHSRSGEPQYRPTSGDHRDLSVDTRQVRSKAWFQGVSAVSHSARNRDTSS